MAIRRAIDAGYFDNWEKDPPPKYEYNIPSVHTVPTILAALRYWMANTEEDERQEMYPSYFEDYGPLDDEEIDQLCEQLNMGDLDIVIR
jgi:hypothetical protein